MRTRPVVFLLALCVATACGPMRVVEGQADEAVAAPDVGPPPPARGVALGTAPVLGTGASHVLTFRQEDGWSCVAMDDGSETCTQGQYVAPEDGTFLRHTGAQGDDDKTCAEWVASADVVALRFATQDGTRWKIAPLQRSLELLGAHVFVACLPSQEFLEEIPATGFDADGTQIAAT